MVVHIEEKDVCWAAWYIEGCDPDGKPISLWPDLFSQVPIQRLGWNQILVVTALLLLGSAWAIHLIGELVH